MADTPTPDEPFQVNPMLELTAEQLARLAAIVNAGELLRGGGLVRGNPADVHDLIDIAEYVIHGDREQRFIRKNSLTVIRTTRATPVTFESGSLTRPIGREHKADAA
jgi:hypothetical protein